MIYDSPIFFEKNRVFRVYKGGALFDKFFADGSVDGDFPEEWLASAVTALNIPPRAQKEGVSITKPDGIYFDDAIKRFPYEMLGETKKLEVLTKILDSAIRLPVQAHPDKEFSMRHFNSPHGKEECWLILETRPNACVYFGFKDGVTREDFERAIELSDKGISDSMEKLLCRYEVKKGDVIYIPANTVHAIGAGCLILEVQEPTDFTIQPERFCGEYKLSDREMYLGLDKGDALDCFEFKPSSQVKLSPIVLEQSNSVKYEELVGKAQTDSFCLRRITLDSGEYPAHKSACVYVVLSGSGRIKSADYSKDIKQGDCFFMPHMAAESKRFYIEGACELVECAGKVK